jgi:hypothetical protein
VDLLPGKAIDGQGHDGRASGHSGREGAGLWGWVKGGRSWPSGRERLVQVRSCARTEGLAIRGQAKGGRCGCGCGRAPVRERIGTWSEEVGDLTKLDLLGHKFGLLDNMEA